SAACRQTLQVRNSDSPSFHSPVCRSNVRGVDATRKLATAAPEGVKRSSGPATRLPTTVIMVSPAMRISRSSRWTGSAALGHGPATTSVGVGANDLRPQHRLIEPELAVELRDGPGLAGQVEDAVNACALVVDVVGEPTPAPDVHLLPAPAGVTDGREVLLQRRGDG